MRILDGFVGLLDDQERSYPRQDGSDHCGEQR